MHDEINHAANATKDPLSYSILTYVWVIAVSAAGGVVSFIRKIRNGTSVGSNIMELLGEVFTAAFVGLVTFWFCEASGISPLWTAVMIAISGHMGTRAIYMFERWLVKRFGGQ